MQILYATIFFYLLFNRNHSYIMFDTEKGEMNLESLTFNCIQFRFESYISLLSSFYLPFFWLRYRSLRSVSFFYSWFVFVFLFSFWFYILKMISYEMGSFSIRTISIIWRFCLSFASNAKSRSLGLNICIFWSKATFSVRRQYPIERPMHKIWFRLPNIIRMDAESLTY